MRIGIVGAENSHCAHIARSLNVDKAVRGVEVTHIWGETAEFARAAAEEGKVATTVEDPTDMIGSVDGVVVDHRHGKDHLPAARPFVEAGIPVFVDKPFCTDLREGVEFVRFARGKGVPITSYSVLSLQQSARRFGEEMRKLGTLRSLVTAGPCDLESEYGGVFFYGIHQVDLICNLIDAAPVKAMAFRSGDDGVAAVGFQSGPTAVMNLLKDWWSGGFTATAYGDEAPGVHHSALPFDDQMYVSGIQLFCKMFETGEEPLPARLYLRPVAVLDAIQRSLEAGGPAEVSTVRDL